MKISDFSQITTRQNDDWLLIEESATGLYKKIKIKDFIVGLSGGVSTDFIKLVGTPFGATPAYAAGSEFDKAFDGNINTFFDYVSASGGYTGIDLGAGKQEIIRRIRFYPRPTYADRMVNGIFQGSTDDISYTALHTISSLPAAGWNEVNISTTQAYRYLRYLSPSGSYGNVVEIEFYK